MECFLFFVVKFVKEFTKGSGSGGFNVGTTNKQDIKSVSGV